MGELRRWVWKVWCGAVWGALTWLRWRAFLRWRVRAGAGGGGVARSPAAAWRRPPGARHAAYSRNIWRARACVVCIIKQVYSVFFVQWRRARVAPCQECALPLLRCLPGDEGLKSFQGGGGARQACHGAVSGVHRVSRTCRPPPQVFAIFGRRDRVEVVGVRAGRLHGVYGGGRQRASSSVHGCWLSGKQGQCGAVLLR